MTSLLLEDELLSIQLFHSSCLWQIGLVHCPFLVHLEHHIVSGFYVDLSSSQVGVPYSRLSGLG